MSKEEESEKRWKYNGKEYEWEVFDRRMQRYMRRKYDRLGERMRLGQVEVVSDDMDPYDYLEYCDNVMKSIEVLDSSEAPDDCERTWTPLRILDGNMIGWIVS